MSQPRRMAQPAPTLVDVYVDAPGTGDDVRAEYRRRWLAWHVETCGRRDCRIHVDPHGIVREPAH